MTVWCPWRWCHSQAPACVVAQVTLQVALRRRRPSARSTSSTGRPPRSRVKSFSLTSSAAVPADERRRGGAGARGAATARSTGHDAAQADEEGEHAARRRSACRRSRRRRRSGGVRRRGRPVVAVSVSRAQRHRGRRTSREPQRHPRASRRCATTSRPRRASFDRRLLLGQPPLLERASCGPSAGRTGAARPVGGPGPPRPSSACPGRRRG